MTGIRPKQFSRMGEFYLEEAVLDVLLEAKYDGKCLTLSEISKRAGIFREKSQVKIGVNMNDAIVMGLIIKLNNADRVQQCTPDKSWELTDAEFESRRDDVSL